MDISCPKQHNQFPNIQHRSESSRVKFPTMLTSDTEDGGSMFSGKVGRGQFKCDGTRAETRFCLSAKRTSPFKSAGASVQSTTGNRGVRISGSNVGYTMFRVSVKSTGYPLHSPVSPSLPLPCVTVCHHISSGVCEHVRLPIRLHGGVIQKTST